MNLQEKIQKRVDDICQEAELDGRAMFSVCNHSNWDRDEWAYRDVIMDAIRNRGFSVLSSVKWGVLDIYVTKQIELI